MIISGSYESWKNSNGGKMDLKGIRTLNLIGTILFPLFSIGIVLIYLPFFLIIPGLQIDEFLNIYFFSFAAVWIVIIIFLTYMLYRNTVEGLDRKQFHQAKRWSLVGTFSGFFLGGGPIVVIIFYISFTVIHEEIHPRYHFPPFGYYPPPYGYGGSYPQPQQPLQYQQPYSQYPSNGMSCPNCGKPIEENWKYCPNCYDKLK
jgi:hypothetical protein